MNEAASSLTAGINDHLPLGKYSHKALERAQAESHLSQQTFLFVLGTWKHLGFKYKWSIRNYWKPVWHLLVHTAVQCDQPLLGASHQTAVLEWELWLQLGWAVVCGSR